MFTFIQGRRAAAWLVLAAGLVHGGAGAATGAVGLSQIPATGQDGTVTLYYPSAGVARTVQRGPFSFQMAEQGAPVRGNGRLVVVSHGTGGSPWVHADVARALVEAGFVVAVAEHRGDNHKDHSDNIGALTCRPAEVSRIIDALGRDARFAPLLSLDRVGVYGMSAGGHTALTLAGGRWAPTRFRDHCEANLVADFQFCVGVITQLTGSWLDGLRQWVAMTAIRRLFDDDTVRGHTDPRVAAVVAAVPAAAVFDMATLAAPRVPVGLITARQDRWLVPRFHSDRVRQACASCVVVADVADGGHGALLSPLPPGLTGILGDMLNDPPGFDRRQMAAVDRQTAAFFSRHLLAAPPPADAAALGPLALR